jgi:dipeptidyl-peptidase 4
MRRIPVCGAACALGMGLILGAATVTPAKKPVTIDDILKPRGEFPSAAIWRPDGKAYVYQEHGKVMLFDAAKAKGTEWFDMAALEKQGKKAADGQKPFNWQNRRVAVNSMEWFPDGRDLLVATPGGLFEVHGDGKAERHASGADGEEEDPKLSPDGTSVLYRHGFNLYVLSLKSGAVVQLTRDGTETRMNGKLDWVYPEELEISTASWWSPDSKAVAYLQFETSKEFVYPQADLLGERAVAEPERYPQAGTPNAEVKLGVVSAAGGATKWMDMGDGTNTGNAYTLISRVNWLPGSRAVAAERLSRVQDKLDLLIADVESGKTHTVLHEESKTWVNFQTSIHFLQKRPAFLWSSEAGNGFRHLYLYGEDGKLIRQLTHGDWEVRQVAAVDEEHGFVYFTSNAADPLEEDLYRVSIEGGEPQRLSKEAGTHRIHAAGNGSYYLDTYSSLTNPPETTLHSASGEQVAVTRAADRKQLDEFDIRPTEVVTLAAEDGTALYAKLIKPAGFDTGKKYPVVVMIYGGPGVGQAVRNSWPGLGWEQVLAHRGYVIWQLDNRGTFGRGHAFEAPIYHEMGKTELADQRAGIAKLIGMGFADEARIGIFGWSYGGYMTLYSLLHAPEVFKAGIAGAPVTDWHNYDTISTERYMGLPGENKEGYTKSSNVLAAEHLKAKLMIVHNFEDDNVLFQNTLQMLNALETADKQFEFMLFPQKSHGVGGPLRKDLYERMTSFFDRNLKGEL